MVVCRMQAANRWKTSQAILVCDKLCYDKFADTIQHFCGKVFGVEDDKLPRAKHIQQYTIVYVTASRLDACLQHEPLNKLQKLHVIAETITDEKEAQNLNTNARVQQVNIFELPILVHNAGVFWRCAFPTEIDFFAKINEEHKAQELTLHANPHKAYRTGFYATEVTKEDETATDDDETVLRFKLLRCSSNFTGGTNNFKETDKLLFDVANRATRTVFPKSTQLNHVLAQIYHNTSSTKAAIAQHSDKTEDMDKDRFNAQTGLNEGGGLIAFASFYKKPFPTTLKTHKTNPLDIIYKHTKSTKDAPSAFTQLRFVRKKCANPQLVESFDIVLYDHSMFVIDLQTNRDYTHEIIPSILPAETIPVRCGYVMRCSDVAAIFKNGQTYYEYAKGKFKLLQPLTTQKAKDLKELYAQENSSCLTVEYPDVDFSMNAGDYTRPIF